MAIKGFLGNSYNLRDGDETRKHYDHWADSYDEELLENQYSQPQRCCEALLAFDLSKDAKLLDVGCGTGLAAAAARDAGYPCIDGCDYSQGMLAKAEVSGHYQRLFTADLNSPPLDCTDSTYDAALVVGVFSFGHVQANAVDDILRVLKPGAPLIIGLNNKFYAEGSLTAKLDQLIASQELIFHRQEAGDHLPGIGLTGWVLSLQKPMAVVTA